MPTKLIYQRVVQDNTGAIQPNVTYEVKNENTGADLTIYSDRNGTIVKSPPHTADSNGLIEFYMNPADLFRVAVTGGSGSFTERYIEAVQLQESATDDESGRITTVGGFGWGSSPSALTTGGYQTLIDDDIQQLRPVFDNSELTGTRFVMNYVDSLGNGVQIAPRGNGLDFDWRGVSAGVPTDWSGMFHHRNLLGTVSQSAGVPTGAVIERGSNANGEYVKFADGTLICTVSAPTQNIAAGARGVYVWNFPAPFVATPFASCTAYYTDVTSDEDVTGTIRNTFNSGAVRLVSINNSAAARDIKPQGLAIGRWF